MGGRGREVRVMWTEHMIYVVLNTHSNLFWIKACLTDISLTVSRRDMKHMKVM